MLTDGRMSLATILVLSPHLKGSAAEELIEECAGKSRTSIEFLLARRHPRSERFEWGTAATSADRAEQAGPAPGRVAPTDAAQVGATPAACPGRADWKPLSEDRVAVVARDGEACAFVSAEGQRCGSRHALQYDHIVPLAQGGRRTVENLRLLCPAHDQYEADRKLGRGFMDSHRAGGRPLVNHELQRREFAGADVESDT